MPKSDEELRGLRGWLILLAIALVGIPGNLLTHAEKAARQFQTAPIIALLTPGNAVYDPRWRALLFVETNAIGFAVFPATALLVLFFFKHRSFPLLFSLFACYIISLMAVRVYLVFAIPSTSDAYRDAILGPSILSAAVLTAWITYLFRSRRVRLTFTRRFLLQPLFPYIATA